MATSYGITPLEGRHTGQSNLLDNYRLTRDESLRHKDSSEEERQLAPRRCKIEIEGSPSSHSIRLDSSMRIVMPHVYRWRTLDALRDRGSTTIIPMKTL